MEGGVFRAQACDLSFQRVGQGVVGRAQVGEFGVAALRGNDYRAEQGIFYRPLLKRTVAVPELVGELENQFAVMPWRDTSGQRDVRDIDQFLVVEPVFGSRGFAQAHVERAELAGAGDLFALVERLIAKHQHRITVHRGLDLAHVGGGQRFLQINAAGFGGKQRMQRLQAEGHVDTSRNCVN